jgi:hypothetical protein
MHLTPESIDRATSAFEDLELGDPRRVERLVLTMRKLAEHPQMSIPQAMASDADLEGAYRLLHNRHVTIEKLAEAYAQKTAERARSVGRVLAIHDTTTCEFAHADPEDVGYLSTGKAGFMAHYSLIVAADDTRRPLGVAHIEVLSRSRPPSAPSRDGRKKRNVSGTASSKNPDREYLRWMRGFRLADDRLEGCSVIHVADREGDSYELLARALERKQRFVIRVRVGDRRARLEDGSKGTLKALARSNEGMLHREVPLSSRKAASQPRAKKTHPPREARLARLTFSATEIEIFKPRYLEGVPDTLTLNMVHVIEQDPPPGEKAIEWMIFTTEPIATAEDVADVVDIYRTRWLIEECNKALKTGCQYEQRQLESRDALLTLLAMSLPIACELLWLRSVCRAQPDRPAKEVLTCIQLQILRTRSSRKLSDEPTVHEALWAVAGLGGHIRCNGEPGWLVLLRGMADLLNMEAGWNAAVEHARRDARLPISR